MSKLKFYWAVIKGWLVPGTSVFLEVVGLALNTLNTFLAAPGVAENVKKTYEIATKVLNVIDRFSDLCPQKWKGDFDRVRAAIGEVVLVFADGKVTKEEADRVTTLFQVEYARWSAD